MKGMFSLGKLLQKGVYMYKLDMKDDVSQHLFING